MKKTVYVDTTVISYLFDERPGLQTYVSVTKEWWNTQSRRFEVFSSAEMIAELKRGNYAHQKKALHFAERISLLPRVEEVEKTAEVYVKQLLMPQDLEGDAVHLAYASYYKIDFLLTWNCKHLANANKRPHIRNVNTLLGLYVPEITTPLELFIEGEYENG